MTDRMLRTTAAALALGGAAIAAYLSYTRLTDTSIICPTTGCATVQRSEYSTLLGVPVAYIGVVGYLAVAVAVSRAGRSARRLASALVLVAAGFASYLLVAQLFLIDAVCTWCVASDGILLALVAVVALRRRVRAA
jgi:uncharacterized membrane protein